jgi:multicomponent Na+:H+ antiporter subunit E
MKKLKVFILLLIILFGLWVMLAGTDKDELIAGGITAFLVSLFFSGRASALGDIRLNPKSLVYMVIYIFVFLRELIKSNFDVAGRVISPSLPIHPGIVKVKTKLKSKLGRTILANSITLTPGTMTVETKGEYFYIHWIDVKCEDIESMTTMIVSGFEKYLEVIFG